MAEYIEREALLTKMKKLFSKEELKVNTSNDIARASILLVEYEPTADITEGRHGKWVLVVKKGSCYDYHVTAHCSKCGWEWIGKDSECVRNNKYVFSAFIQGKQEIAEQFALDNAKQRHLYDYCPNCGARMDLGDDEE